MPALSVDPTASAINRVQLGLRSVAAALASTSLDILSGAIGKDDSTVCRIRSEDAKVSISDAIRLVYAAGMKIVGAEKVCVDRARYEAIVTMASAAMSDEQTVRRLTWDE